MREIDITADDLVGKLMGLNAVEFACVLDSCGVGHLGSHLLIAGVRPTEVLEITHASAEYLEVIDAKLSGHLAAIFSLSYDFGKARKTNEPDAFLALFDVLVIHDYSTSQTYLVGNESKFEEIEVALTESEPVSIDEPVGGPESQAISNFTRAEYLSAVERIRECIRSGDTYQTNLTQQIRCRLPDSISPRAVFSRLRRDHPAPFAAYLRRGASEVISASPERFFRVRRNGMIDTSPIKGTRPRGNSPAEDRLLRNELEKSAKDRAENTMIVDLMRNDLGRVCQFGSVVVEKLCDVEEHPTLFHLVSTVSGKLNGEPPFSQLLDAIFPCGSITGAPKVRTMQIIDELEPSPRGLSMGAIGIYFPRDWNFDPINIDAVFDLSVAIRTMVVADGEAVFNVGGGVVIDSETEREYDESLLKAKALLNAVGAVFDPE
jgi:para-aminobenzoate synthetase component I